MFEDKGNFSRGEGWKSQGQGREPKPFLKGSRMSHQEGREIVPCHFTHCSFLISIWSVRSSNPDLKGESPEVHQWFLRLYSVLRRERL